MRARSTTLGADQASGTSARRDRRIERLAALIERAGTTRLDDAARALEVSTMTLRRDLADGRSGFDLLGGHVAARSTSATQPPYTLGSEQASHVRAKAEAGRRAASLVRPGDTIFVDCGTTMPHFMAALPTDLDITIVCYALNVAVSASRMRAARLFLLGGLFHAAAATFFSEEALRSLHHVGINKAFLSAGGLHETFGASCSNFNEVPVKRAVLDRAVQSFLVIDSSKHGLLKPAPFAPVAAFAQVIDEVSHLPTVDSALRHGGNPLTAPEAARIASSHKSKKRSNVRK